MKKKPGYLLLIACWSSLCFAQQVVVTDATLSGNGTTATPLKIAQHSATTDQVLKWSGTSWLPKVDGLSLPFIGKTNLGTYGIRIDHTANIKHGYGGIFTSYGINGGGVFCEGYAKSGVSYGGAFRSNSTNGIGVYSTAIADSGNTYGGYFESHSTGGIAVYGKETATSGTNYGGYFETSSTYGRGVMGWATATSGNNYGGFFVSSSYAGIGVSGRASKTTGLSFGGAFSSSGDQGRGVLGSAPATSGNNYGGYFYSNSPGGIGVYGTAPVYAGKFDGTVLISKNLFVKGFIVSGEKGNSFQIDHPLDPANKILRHSFVESPDMMNVYNGNIITDGNGTAEVKLPDYFESLNKDFCYQLTVIGVFAQAIIAEKISNNRFTIRTDKPNVEVSWQVTGVRQDPWAKDNQVVIESDKDPKERGYYLYPQGYGQPENRSMLHEETKMMQEVVREPENFPKEPLPLPKEVPELEFDK